MVSQEALAFAIMLDRVELLPRPLMAELQLERLRDTVSRVLRGPTVGAERLAAAGVTDSRDVRSLDDLGTLPFLTQADLRAHQPFGRLAVPRRALVRMHVSSSPRHDPTLVAWTRADVDQRTELITRCMRLAGVREGMLIHNVDGEGRFIGGLGFDQAAERLRAAVVPRLDGDTTRQATLLSDLGTQVLVATPSFALGIAQVLSDTGMGSDALGLELGLFGGESWTDELRAEIERGLGLRAVNVYGLSELGMSGVAAECLEARDGMHVHEDHFLVEVIDPRDRHPVAPGVDGEIVLTALNQEAMPLLRYRTGDLGHLVEEPCACGRPTVRLHVRRGPQGNTVAVDPGLKFATDRSISRSTANSSPG